MAIFKQSTPIVHQFSMVLSSDGVTGSTGKSTSLAVKLGKAGATGVAAGGALAEVDAVNLPGVYSINFTAVDVNTIGSLALAATATGCNATREVHQVSATITSDIQLSGSGRVLVANNLQQNAITTAFPFTMTNLAGVLTTGLTVTVQRTLGAGGFAPSANSVTEIGSGWYAITLAASDLNSATVGLHITAPGAQTLTVPLVPTP